MKGTSPTALSFLLTLRQLAAWLVVSDSHQEPTLHVLFLSMAPAQRTEVIGLTSVVSQKLGHLSREFSALQQSEPAVSPQQH